MGYGYYVLSDGREAGYGVEAECDFEGCSERIDRGLGYLCGDNPDGWRDEDDPGCGDYFCAAHEFVHDCLNPECDAYSEDDEHGPCGRAKGHEGSHRDYRGEFEATTESETTP